MRDNMMTYHGSALQIYHGVENPHDLISFMPKADAIDVKDLLNYLQSATPRDIVKLVAVLELHEIGACEPHEFAPNPPGSGICEICNGGKKFPIHQN